MRTRGTAIPWGWVYGRVSPDLTSSNPGWSWTWPDLGVGWGSKFIPVSIFTQDMEPRSTLKDVVVNILLEIVELCAKKSTNTGWAKNRLFLRLIIVMVSSRNACDTSKFYKFCPEKEYKTCVSVWLNILCLICMHKYSLTLKLW